MSRPPAPAGVRILAALDNAAQLLKHDLTITCADGRHGPDDPHTHGEAYDVRTSDLLVDQVVDLCDELEHSLGPAFTVLYEIPPNVAYPAELGEWVYFDIYADAPHLHVQRKKDTVFPPLP